MARPLRLRLLPLHLAAACACFGLAGGSSCSAGDGESCSAGAPASTGSRSLGRDLSGRIAGGRILPRRPVSGGPRAGAFVELWASRVLISGLASWVPEDQRASFLRVASGSLEASALLPALEAAVRQQALLYLASLRNSVHELSVDIDVVSSGDTDTCLPWGLLPPSARHGEQALLLGLLFFDANGVRVIMDDPRGPAVTVGPFNQQFAYRPESGDLLLFPSWASLSIASASNSRCPKVAIVSILLRGPPPDSPSSKDRRVLSTLELIDNSVAVATLESAPEDPLFVGSPERGIGPLDLHAVLAPIGGHLATKGGDVPGAVVLDIFGSPVLRIGFAELLASLSEPGALTDVAAFNEELARLADRGLALPEVRKLPRHARAEAFFEWQRRQWGEGRPWDALQGSRAFSLLRRLFARAAEHFLALFAAVDSVDAEDERMFIWAASLGAGQGHEEHDHPGSAVSGVYYARSPEGAGRLLLKDPRGPYPPFQVGVWGMPPKAGDFLLFPGWLRHKVESSIFPEKTTPRRVAYSMNLAGKWEVSAHTYHQLELAL